METNDVLIATSLTERALTMVSPNTRTPISRTTLGILKNTISGIYSKLLPYTKETLILLPLTECTELIDLLLSDKTLVESDIESKEILTEKLTLALHEIYIFAGTFYSTDNEFIRTSPALDNLLINIVTACINQGMYFGIEKELAE